MICWALLNAFNYHREVGRHPLEHWIICLCEFSPTLSAANDSSNVWTDRGYIYFSRKSRHTPALPNTDVHKPSNKLVHREGMRISQLLPCNILPSVTSWSNTSWLSSVIRVAPHNQTLSDYLICCQLWQHMCPASLISRSARVPFQKSLQQLDTVKKSSLKCRHLQLHKNNLCSPYSQRDWYRYFFAWDSTEPPQQLSWDETIHAKGEYLPHWQEHKVINSDTDTCM